MLRQKLAFTAISLAFAGMAGCGGAHTGDRADLAYATVAEPPVQLEVTQPFFIPGEQLEWEISLRGIVGGEAVMAMGHPGKMEGRSVIIVKSQVRSAGVVELIKEVRDDVVSWVDVDSGAPIKHTADLKFGDKESEVVTTFDADGYHLDYHRIGKRRYEKEQALPGGAVAHDGHSILGVFRAWEPEDGTRAFFYVLSGRRLWRNDVVFVGRETVKSRMGATPAVKIEGVATRLTSQLLPDRRKKPRHYTVWISDDANRLPVKVTAKTEYGDVVVDLVQYERPARHIVRK